LDDFNSIRARDEWKGGGVFEGKFVGKEYQIIFNLFVQMLGLIDFPLLGRKFMLFNRMVDT